MSSLVKRVYGALAGSMEASRVAEDAGIGITRGGHWDQCIDEAQRWLAGWMGGRYP